MRIDEEKYQNVILFLCSKLADKSIHGKKKLAKLLYYIDFDRFEFNESMVSITGDTYVRLKMGPVPNSFEGIVGRMSDLGMLEVSEKLEFEGQKKPTVIYRALKEPKMSIFDDEESFILNRVATKYAQLTGKDLEELSHREAPWVAVEHRDEIPFELAFYRGTDFSDEMRAA